MDELGLGGTVFWGEPEETVALFRALSAFMSMFKQVKINPC